MKVFISWSGEVSHRVAVILRDWLPAVIQSIEPYVSSEDIDKGTRWSTDIAAELHASTYGLICLTKNNVAAPWINFEAGALGKSIDKSRVSPFLFRLKRSEVEGPLLQFQSTVLEKEDIHKLLKSINAACGSEGLEDARLAKSLDVWWPQLEQQLNAISEPHEAPEPPLELTSPVPLDEISRVLEEVLELTRKNHKILRSPDELFPADYLQHVIRRPSRNGDVGVNDLEGKIHPGAVKDLVMQYREVLKLLGVLRLETEHNSGYFELLTLLRKMEAPVRHMAGRIGLRLPRETVLEKEEF